MLAAARVLPRWGSRRTVQVALLGYCASGPLVGLSGSLATFFAAFMLWGAFQGALDVSMNTQAIFVEQDSARALMPGFHGSWSIGSLVGAGVGALAVGLDVPLSEQLLILATPVLFFVGWLTTQMIPDRPFDGAERSNPRPRHDRGVLQVNVLVLGSIALADMLCEGAAGDWTAVYLRGTVHVAAAIAGLGYVAYAFSMVVVRLSGNRLLTRYSVHHLLPLLSGVAALVFAVGLVLDRPVSLLIGFATLGAGLACVVPAIFSAAGSIRDTHTGQAVATVSACGWAGFVLGPVLIGGIASSTSLRTALFLIPLLTLVVALATWVAPVLRQNGAEFSS